VNVECDGGTSPADLGRHRSATCSLGIAAGGDVGLSVRSALGWNARRRRVASKERSARRWSRMPSIDGPRWHDASGHAQAGGRSMVTERSESWSVRIAPSGGQEGCAGMRKMRIDKCKVQIAK